MNRIDIAYNRLGAFAEAIASECGFTGALRTAYKPDAEGLSEVIAMLCQDIHAARSAIEDREDYCEILYDLVQAKAQDDIGCVPPVEKTKWARIWARAAEPFEP
jgi:hypothetical protein